MARGSTAGAGSSQPSTSAGVGDASSSPDAGTCRHTFPNGDVYCGSVMNDLPHGFGRYEWSDGSYYEGEWCDGVKHGNGKYRWASNSSYEGQWVDGCMQGIGVYGGADGSEYQGSFVRDKKSGYGKKKYPNGDVYEGLWKDDLAETLGIYTWLNGDKYNGEWRQGKMHGHGTFVWHSGERYDGEWSDGLENGPGLFIWADGSAFYGFWADGKKHGFGVWWRESDRTGPGGAGASQGAEGAPHRASFAALAFGAGSGARGNDEDASSQQPKQQGLQSGDASLGRGAHASASTNGAQASGSGAPAGEGSASREGGPGGERAGREAAPSVSTDKLSLALAENKVIGREYEHGKLAREVWIDRDKVALPSLRATRQPAKRTKKYHKKTVQGETIVKGHRSYELMLNLQLGIRFSIGKVNEEAVTPLQVSDFDKNLDRQKFFPHNGSADTPPHTSTDFYWKTYCAKVFRDLRVRFGCNPGNYVMSLCGEQALRELSSPGKSGSVFYISDDDQYICKSLRKSELGHLCNILPSYYKHVIDHRRSILPKFYGLHRITNPQKSQRVRFVVMANVFCRDLPIHRKYDLKGSVVGRTTASPVTEDTILKDLDLDCTFKLEKQMHADFFSQLKEDCAFLERMNIMDYSLLLGVHFTDQEDDEDGGAGGGGGKGGPGGAANLGTIAEDEAPTAARSLDAGMGNGLRDEAEQGVAVQARGSDDDEEEGEGGEKAPMGAMGDVEAQVRQLNKITLGRERRSSQMTVGHPLKTRTRRSDTMRPVCDLKGLEELSVAMGVPFHVELGLNMPATVVYDAKTGKQPRDAIVFFGIIDVLQDYNARKLLESNSKALVYRRSEISAVSPALYSRRFQEFMKKVFL